MIMTQSNQLLCCWLLIAAVYQRWRMYDYVEFWRVYSDTLQLIPESCIRNAGLAWWGERRRSCFLLALSIVIVMQQEEQHSLWGGSGLGSDDDMMLHYFLVDSVRIGMQVKNASVSAPSSWRRAHLSGGPVLLHYLAQAFGIERLPCG
jgi:hypothetical protein